MPGVTCGTMASRSLADARQAKLPETDMPTDLPTAMPKVLISDALSEAALRIFAENGVEADFRPELGRDPARLAEAIGGYDGLAVRSATKVTPAILERAGRLGVIGRAGIGVDNIDLDAASARGVVVMNTPFGNSITTAEHAIALMFALARQIPQANASTHAGKWEKSAFLGVEITGKILGLVGCGNIGSVVASRAIGLRMKVIAFDPFLSAGRARELGVEKVGELDDLLGRADFVSLHLPRTEKTANILSAERIRRMKPGARLINCARGGLVDEAAVVEALRDGRLAGAAFDVFAVEPATDNPLFGLPNVVATPHLGASTTEAQENVALQVAEQMSAYLMRGAIQNAINAPSITAEEAPILRPWVRVAEVLGGLWAGVRSTWSRRRWSRARAASRSPRRGWTRRAPMGRIFGWWSSPRRRPGRLRRRSSRTASRASSRSRASIWRPSRCPSCSTRSTPTRLAISARWGRGWARWGSTSRPLRSAGPRRAARRSRCSASTIPWRRRCWPRSRRCRRCARPRRWRSRPGHVGGGSASARGAHMWTPRVQSTSRTAQMMGRLAPHGRIVFAWRWRGDSAWAGRDHAVTRHSDQDAGARPRGGAALALLIRPCRQTLRLSRRPRHDRRRSRARS
jgi:phosphoglycerate dehydrogenase-like enzyme